MNYINVLLAKINHFNRKMADSNYSDICSFYHSNYSSTKFHIHFSPNYKYKLQLSCNTYTGILHVNLKPINKDLLQIHETEFLKEEERFIASHSLVTGSLMLNTLAVKKVRSQ